MKKLKKTIVKSEELMNVLKAIKSMKKDYKMRIEALEQLEEHLTK